MKRHIIMDGYNVMHRWANERFMLLSAGLEQKRDAFVKQLQDYQDLQGEELTIVFDGYSGRDKGSSVKRGQTKASPRQVKVLFSKTKQSADTVIEAMVAQDKHPQSLLVVTADRQIAQLVRGYGAQVWSPEFLEQDLKQVLASMRKDLDFQVLKPKGWRVEDRL